MTCPGVEVVCDESLANVLRVHDGRILDDGWLRVCIDPSGQTPRARCVLCRRYVTAWRHVGSNLFRMYQRARYMPRRESPTRERSGGKASHSATLAARCRVSRCGDHGTEWPHPDRRG